MRERSRLPEAISSVSFPDAYSSSKQSLTAADREGIQSDLPIGALGLFYSIRINRSLTVVLGGNSVRVTSCVQHKANRLACFVEGFSFSMENWGPAYEMAPSVVVRRRGDDLR